MSMTYNTWCRFYGFSGAPAWAMSRHCPASSHLGSYRQHAATFCTCIPQPCMSLCSPSAV